MSVYLMVTVNTEYGKTNEFAKFWREKALPEWEKHGAKHIASYAYYIGGPFSEIVRIIEFANLAKLDEFNDWLRTTKDGQAVSKMVAPYLVSGSWKVLRPV